MKPETVERLAFAAAHAWEISQLSEYFVILDRNRAKVNRAIESGRITFDAANEAWKRGIAKGGAA